MIKIFNFSIYFCTIKTVFRKKSKENENIFQRNSFDSSCFLLRNQNKCIGNRAGHLKIIFQFRAKSKSID